MLLISYFYELCIFLPFQFSNCISNKCFSLYYAKGWEWLAVSTVTNIELRNVVMVPIKGSSIKLQSLIFLSSTFCLLYNYTHAFWLKTDAKLDFVILWNSGIKRLKGALPPQELNDKLPRFLQKCAQTFESDHRYRNDARYVRVWIELVQSQSQSQSVFGSRFYYCFSFGFGTQKII